MITSGNDTGYFITCSFSYKSCWMQNWFMAGFSCVNINKGDKKKVNNLTPSKWCPSAKSDSRFQDKSKIKNELSQLRITLLWITLIILIVFRTKWKTSTRKKTTSTRKKNSTLIHLKGVPLQPACTKGIFVLMRE